MRKEYLIAALVVLLLLVHPLAVIATTTAPPPTPTNQPTTTYTFTYTRRGIWPGINGGRLLIIHYSNNRWSFAVPNPMTRSEITLTTPQLADFYLDSTNMGLYNALSPNNVDFGKGIDTISNTLRLDTFGWDSKLTTEVVTTDAAGKVTKGQQDYGPQDAKSFADSVKETYNTKKTDASAQSAAGGTKPADASPPATTGGAASGSGSKAPASSPATKPEEPTAATYSKERTLELKDGTEVTITLPEDISTTPDAANDREYSSKDGKTKYHFYDDGSYAKITQDNRVTVVYEDGHTDELGRVNSAWLNGDAGSRNEHLSWLALMTAISPEDRKKSWNDFMGTRTRTIGAGEQQKSYFDANGDGTFTLNDGDQKQQYKFGTIGGDKAEVPFQQIGTGYFYAQGGQFYKRDDKGQGKSVGTDVGTFDGDQQFFSKADKTFFRETDEGFEGYSNAREYSQGEKYSYSKSDGEKKHDYFYDRSSKNGEGGEYEGKMTSEGFEFKGTSYGQWADDHGYEHFSRDKSSSSATWIPETDTKGQSTGAPSGGQWRYTGTDGEERYGYYDPSNGNKKYESSRKFESCGGGGFCSYDGEQYNYHSAAGGSWNNVIPDGSGGFWGDAGGKNTHYIASGGCMQQFGYNNWIVGQCGTDEKGGGTFKPGTTFDSCVNTVYDGMSRQVCKGAGGYFDCTYPKADGTCDACTGKCLESFGSSYGMFWLGEELEFWAGATAGYSALQGWFYDSSVESSWLLVGDNEFFKTAFGGKEAWIAYACLEQVSDANSNGVAIGFMNPGASAHIEGERTQYTNITLNGSQQQYLYKITLDVTDSNCLMDWNVFVYPGEKPLFSADFDDNESSQSFVGQSMIIDTSTTKYDSLCIKWDSITPGCLDIDNNKLCNEFADSGSREYADLGCPSGVGGIACGVFSGSGDGSDDDDSDDSSDTPPTYTGLN